MSRILINILPGCEHPDTCRRRSDTELCINCLARQGLAETPFPRDVACVVRIELTKARRRKLGDMAIASGISVDEKASELLSGLIDKAPKPRQSTSSAAERVRLHEHNRAGEKESKPGETPS